MKAGTIVFHGADLALYGAPKFTMRKFPEPAPPAAATHRRVEISVGVELRAEMPATVWARARALQALLASTREGLLELRDENGTVVSWRATPGENTLPQAIERGSGRVEMSFSAIEAVTDNGLAATLDPLDGSPVIELDRVGEWSMNVGISRPDDRAANRSQVSSGVNFTARTAMADPLLDAADRAAALLVEAERLRSLSGKQAHLSFAGFSRVVQVESFRATPSSGWEWIDLEAQVRFNTLPGDTEAEVTFQSEPVTDPATGETRTTVSGTVRAPDKATADAKIDAILAAWRTPARRVARISRKDSWLDGEDGDAWTGVEFSIELTEGSATPRFTVKIDTREAPDGRRVTYSGTAYASTLEALLATIEQAAGNKHPILTRDESSIDFATDDQGTEKLMGATFSREYVTAATRILGTATLTSRRGRFGDYEGAVSGSVSAPDMTMARSVARSFIPSNVILRTDDENEDHAVNATTAATPAVSTQAVTLAFSYSWGTAHANTAIQYEDTSAPDYTRMVESREISGVAWAADKTTAQTAVNTLIQNLMGANAKASRSSFTQSHEREIIAATVNDRWLAFRFSYAFETGLTGTIGHDIIEAQFALQRIGMVDHVPITEIPLQKPVTQLTGGTLANPVGFGYNIGRLVASGSIKARVQATARAWGQAKQASAKSITVPGGTYHGAADPPDERMAVTYLPFNGTTAAFHEFSFQYSFRYADGLTGLWPSSGLTV